jgi:hypothetical protein
MKRLTIAMMLTLLVAGLVIGCSSASEAPNLSEEEAIGIARSSGRGSSGCFQTKAPEDVRHESGSQVFYQSYTDFTHSESASFKPSGIWVVTAKSSWAWSQGRIVKISVENVESGVAEPECTIVVDDVTGTVTQN